MNNWDIYGKSKELFVRRKFAAWLLIMMEFQFSYLVVDEETTVRGEFKTCSSFCPWKVLDVGLQTQQSGSRTTPVGAVNRHFPCMHRWIIILTLIIIRTKIKPTIQAQI